MIGLANGLFVAALLSPLVSVFWPCDWRGRRKSIKLKPRDREWGE